MEENYFESASERKLRFERKRKEKIFENYIKKSDAWFARKVKNCFKDTRAFLRQYNHHDESSYSGDIVYCYYKFVMGSIKFLNTYMTEKEWINFCDKFTEFEINDLLLPDKFPQENEESGIITINNITSSTSWKLYYFYTSPAYATEEPKLKAFLLRDCRVLTDMFDVSEIVCNLLKKGCVNYDNY